MLIRFYDIVIDAVENGDNTLTTLNEDVKLYIEQRDLNDAIERAEYIGNMMDVLSEHTGKDVNSFRYEVVA